MKRNILALLLLSASLVTFAHARFFIGVDAGYGIASADLQAPNEGYTGFEGITTPKDFYKNAFIGNNYLLNLNLGTQHYFDENESVGFRWFFLGGYGRTNLKTKDAPNDFPSNIFNLGVGADILLDVIRFGDGNRVGMFLGVQEQLYLSVSDTNIFEAYHDSYSKHNTIKSFKAFNGISFPTQFRAGISLLLQKHHRVEFVAQIPVFTIGFESDFYDTSLDKNTARFYYKPIQLMLGYKFVF